MICIGLACLITGGYFGLLRPAQSRWLQERKAQAETELAKAIAAPTFTSLWGW